MKKNRIIGIIIICIISYIQYNFIHKESSTEIKLMNIFNMAFADSENCLGSTYIDRKAKTGATCTCNGQLIMPQTCVLYGDGCTEIICSP